MSHFRAPRREVLEKTSLVVDDWDQADNRELVPESGERAEFGTAAIDPAARELDGMNQDSDEEHMRAEILALEQDWEKEGNVDKKRKAFLIKRKGASRVRVDPESRDTMSSEMFCAQNSQADDLPKP